MKLKLFKKHCGLPREQSLKHMRAFANMCNYVADKRAIEEAFILVCGMNNIEPYGNIQPDLCEILIVLSTVL